VHERRVNIHRLWNDRDYSCPAGVVGQRGNVCDNRYDKPFPPGAPIEGIIVGVERLGNQNEAVGADLQSRPILIATWIGHIAFERLFFLVDVDRPKVKGNFIRLGGFQHGWNPREKKGRRKGGSKKESFSQVLGGAAGESESFGPFRIRVLFPVVLPGQTVK